MKTVSLIAVNEECKEQENKLKEFLCEQLKKHDIKLLDFKSNRISQMVTQSKENAEKVFIVFDAQKGMNATFSTAVKELYKQNVRPILIITNADLKGVDLNFAKNAIAQIWSIEDPYLESWELIFDTLYFSYAKMGFDSKPEVDKTGIDILIDTILE